MFKNNKCTKTEFLFLRRTISLLSKNLYQVLNSIHNKKLPERFWLLLFTGWLNKYVRILYLQWRYVNSRPKNFVFKLDPRLDLKISDCKDLKKTLDGFLFQESAIKEIVLFKNREFIYLKKEKKIDSSKDFFFYIKNSFLKKIFFYLLKLVIRFMPTVKKKIFFYQTIFKYDFIKKNFGNKVLINSFYFYLFVLINFLIIKLSEKQKFKRDLFIHIFKKKIKTKAGSFNDFLYQKFSKDCPDFVIENFENYFYNTKDIFRAKKIFSSYAQHQYKNLYLKFLFAKQILFKSKIVWIVEGGTFRSRTLGTFNPKIFELVLTWFKTNTKKKIQLPYNPILDNYKDYKYRKSKERKKIGVFLKPVSSDEFHFNYGHSREDGHEIFSNFEKLNPYLKKDFKIRFLFKKKKKIFNKKN